MGGAEGNLDELLAQQVEIGRFTEGTVVHDGLVHHVPAVHLTFVVAHHGLDMLDESLAQHLLRGGTGGVAIGEPPVGGLRVPYETMANDLQPMLLTVAHELIGHTEVEDALGWSQRLGLHAVLGRGAVEVAVHHDVCLGHLTVALPLVDGCANEEMLAQRILQALLSHGCQRHHGQAEHKGLHSLIHSCCVLQSLG